MGNVCSCGSSTTAKGHVQPDPPQKYVENPSTLPSPLETRTDDDVDMGTSDEGGATETERVTVVQVVEVVHATDTPQQSRSAVELDDISGLSVISAGSKRSGRARTMSRTERNQGKLADVVAGDYDDDVFAGISDFSAEDALSRDRRGSLRDDEEVPPAADNLERDRSNDFDEENESDMVPSLTRPNRRRRSTRGRVDLSRFSEDFAEKTFALDEEDAGSRRLDAMVRSGDYSYASSKMSEILQVKQQTIDLNQQLNLFFNPALVRAVLEILKAKEIQISNALTAHEIDDDEFDELSNGIEHVRQLIAERTNRNTLTAARRALHRTKTAGSVQASKHIATGAPTDVTIDVLSANEQQRQKSVHLRRASNRRSSRNPFLTPGHARNQGSVVSGTSEITNLFSVCIKEAFVAVLGRIQRDLIRACIMNRQTHLQSWIEKQWNETLNKDSTDFASQARLLNRVTEVIERAHPEHTIFKACRRRIKECLLTVELMDLQAASHQRLVNPQVERTKEAVRRSSILG